MTGKATGSLISTVQRSAALKQISRGPRGARSIPAVVSIDNNTSAEIQTGSMSSNASRLARSNAMKRMHADSVLNRLSEYKKSNVDLTEAKKLASSTNDNGEINKRENFWASIKEQSKAKEAFNIDKEDAAKENAGGTNNNQPPPAPDISDLVKQQQDAADRQKNALQEKQAAIQQGSRAKAKNLPMSPPPPPPIDNFIAEQQNPTKKHAEEAKKTIPTKTELNDKAKKAKENHQVKNFIPPRGANENIGKITEELKAITSQESTIIARDEAVTKKRHSAVLQGLAKKVAAINAEAEAREKELEQKQEKIKNDPQKKLALEKYRAEQKFLSERQAPIPAVKESEASNNRMQAHIDAFLKKKDPTTGKSKFDALQKSEAAQVETQGTNTGEEKREIKPQKRLVINPSADLAKAAKAAYEQRMKRKLEAQEKSCPPSDTNKTNKDD